MEGCPKLLERGGGTLSAQSVYTKDAPPNEPYPSMNPVIHSGDNEIRLGESK